MTQEIKDARDILWNARDRVLMDSDNASIEHKVGADVAWKILFHAEKYLTGERTTKMWYEASELVVSRTRF
jgi:hypothetical protein